MNMHDQVVSLELAKKLKELNVDFPSIFSWDYYSDTCYDVKFIPFSCPDNKNFKAYTASELFEMIPKYITLDESYSPFENYSFKLIMFNTIESNMESVRNYRITYQCDSTEAGGEDAGLIREAGRPIFDCNLCNALAKTLIWIIEDKHMEVPK